MIIGLDIDDVIFDTSNYIERILNDIEDSELNKIKLDVLRGNPNIPRVKEFLTKYLPLAIENAEPKDGAIETIENLRAQGHQIILITARGDKFFPGTEEKNEQVLRKNNIEYDKIVYNCISKIEGCKENKVDIFVDDSPRNCLEVKEALDIPVIGFESRITAEELHKHQIPSIRNWTELKKALNNVIN